MCTEYRWRNCVGAAAFLLVLAGCRQEASIVPDVPVAPEVAPVAPKALTPVAVQPGPPEKPAAKPAIPASLAEATRVIDFRRFPILDDGKDLYKSADVPKGDTGKDLRKSEKFVFYYLRRKDGAKAAEFYRTQFTEAGWKLGEGSIEYGKAYDGTKYFMFSASKQGFHVSGGVIENPPGGDLCVNFTNHGNIDSRTLPRFAGAAVQHSNFWGTTYSTDATTDAVLEFTQAELKKAGWRLVKLPARFKRDEQSNLRFIQRGIQIDADIDIRQDKTEVRYHVKILRVELPIMAEARGQVEFLDGEKSLLHLFYAVPVKPEKVLEFYKKEMPAFGWTTRPGTDKIEDGEAKVMFDAPEKEPLRLELLATKEGDTVLLVAEGPGKEKKVTPKKAVKPPHVVTEKELQFEGKLAKDSPKLKGEPVNVHAMKMSPEKTYVIDMESKDFDAYLRILDGTGKQLAFNDDGGDNRNARIRFTPPREGEYQIVATRFGSGQGNYVLRIRVLGAGAGK